MKTGPSARSSSPGKHGTLRLLDPAWQKLAGLPVETNVCRAWIERPRGHAKTSDMAMQIAWILRFANRPLNGIVAAADQDQAALIRDAFARLVYLNAWMFATVDAAQASHREPRNRQPIDGDFVRRAKLVGFAGGLCDLR